MKIIFYRKLLFLLFFIIFSYISFSSESGYSGENISLIEISKSNYKNTKDFTIIPIEGDIDFYNNLFKFDGNLKYKLAKSFNNNIEEIIDYKAFGGRWQYNKFKNLSLGFKGALDNDYIFLNKKNYYNKFEQADYISKTGRVESEESFGINFFANTYLKLSPKFTIGVWNEYVESNVNKIFPTKNRDNNCYITMTPRIIYVENFGNLKLVGEAYVDLRTYFKGNVELNSEKEDFFYKIIINPQLIYEKKDKKMNIFIYSNLENEKMMNIDFWQHTFKFSPRLKVNLTENLSFGIKGAGYEKQNEIGITFDNDELIGIKKSDAYLGKIFAMNLYLKYNFYKNFSIGNENIFRKGKWIQENNGNYLDENINSTYIEYSIKYSDKNQISLKGSYEFYRYKSDLGKFLVEEDILRLRLKWQHFM